MSDQLRKFISNLPSHLTQPEAIKRYIASNFVYRGNFSTSIYQYNQLTKKYDLLVETNHNNTNWTHYLTDLSWNGKSYYELKEAYHY